MTPECEKLLEFATDLRMLVEGRLGMMRPDEQDFCPALVMETPDGIAYTEIVEIANEKGMAPALIARCMRERKPERVAIVVRAWIGIYNKSERGEKEWEDKMFGVANYRDRPRRKEVIEIIAADPQYMVSSRGFIERGDHAPRIREWMNDGMHAQFGGALPAAIRGGFNAMA